jgi:uncharacterized membrane protein
MTGEKFSKFIMLAGSCEFLRRRSNSMARSILNLLIVNAVIGGLVYLLLTYYAPSRIFSYDLHKFLHVAGVVIFLGNVITTALWVFLAERSKDPSVIRFAVSTISRMDLYFTQPGVMLIVLNGLLLTTQGNDIYKTSWIAASLASFTLSGIVWGAVLKGHQRSLVNLSHAPQGTNDALPEEFFPVLHKWYRWGIVAIILPLISLMFMSVKPNLW